MTVSPNLDAVHSLDLESKVRLLTGASMFTLAAEPRLGLRAMSFSDGPTGVRGQVVQVDFRPADEAQPVRLVGWSAVTLEPGAAQDVSVVLDRRMWRRWDVGRSSWQTLADEGRLLVARGLGDVRGVIDL